MNRNRNRNPKPKPKPNPGPNPNGALLGVEREAYVGRALADQKELLLDARECLVRVRIRVRVRAS